MKRLDDFGRSDRTAVACACGGLLGLLCAAHCLGQCGAGGNCYLVHGPGCDNTACCTTICAFDSYCCNTAWDSLCVQEAVQHCVLPIVGGPIENPDNGHVYFVSAPAPWGVAEQAAQSLGGHLVTINDGAENQWTAALMSAQWPTFWIGLNDIQTEGAFVWASGEPWTFANWMPDEPSNLGNEDGVLSVTSMGLWADYLVTQAYYSLVEVAPTACGGPYTGGCGTPHESPFCSDADCCENVCSFDPYCCQVRWDSICVVDAMNTCTVWTYAGPMVNPATGRRHVLQVGGGWISQQAFAQANGSLLTVRSPAENEFVRRTFGQSVPGIGPTYLWVGLSDHETEGTFLWSSGAPLTFTNWMPGQPADAFLDDFVVMRSDTGQWFDAPGNAAFRAVTESGAWAICGSGGSCTSAHGPGCDTEACCTLICEFDPYCCLTAWDASCVNHALLRCSPQVIMGPYVDPATGHVYYGLSAAMWTEAERIANELGGHLAVPNTPAENAWIAANFLQVPGGLESVHIGVHDQLVEGVFQALDVVGPNAITYAPWLPGEPNNQENEDMVHMQTSGGWNDITRWGVHPAVVEVACRGDLNGDGQIGAVDLGMLLGAWGVAPNEDLTFDGRVDAQDLAILLGAWGPCASSDCCSAHGYSGCDQPGCTQCVCELDPFCCVVQWDGACASEAAAPCNVACQCGG